MFTGIIESLGEVREIASESGNKTFWITSPLSTQFRVDQSVSHDGVCLTVEEVVDGAHRVTAISETLKKTTLSQWIAGTRVNIERSLLPSSRLDGHFVQGHVDDTGTCEKIEDKAGSREVVFSFPKEHAALVIEKGSISINGVSLTAFDVKKKSFRVALIPYTWEHTNLNLLTEGSLINLEFDLIGKYILRRQEVQG